MKLTHTNLGFAIRALVYSKYRTAQEAADDMNMDVRELRRLWARDKNQLRHASFMRMAQHCNRLGYDVHFEIKPRVQELKDAA